MSHDVEERNCWLCTSFGLMIQQTEVWLKHEDWKTLRADQLCSGVVHLASKAFIGNKYVLYT